MLKFIGLFFTKTWELFSIKWPGFDFPIWAAFLGVAFAIIALSLVGRLFGVSVGSSISGVYSSVRSYDSRKMKIDSKRQGDTK